MVQRGEGLWLLHTEWASAVLYNSLGRYNEAFIAAEKAVAHPHELGVSTWVQPEFIEAAARSGRAEHAVGPMRRLREISSAAGTNWALGVEARSRALLNDGDVAEGLYREAIALLSRTRVRTRMRAHTWSTASGYDVNAAAWRRASTFGSPTTCTSKWA